ncbi:MAG: S9 family peptidase [Alphaproteobacteria bacterium]|nr:S9 family peptidase [Alphaproteobacteria bacterium]
MIVRFTAAVVVAAASANALAQPVEGGPLQAIDVFAFDYATDPQISPDGERIAYQRRTNDIMTDSTRSGLWVIDYDGEGHRPIAAEDGSASGPAWSPDSSRVAYAFSKDGESSLRVAWPGEARSAVIASLPAGPSQIAWSPDGEWIAFIMFEAGEEPQVDIGLPDQPEGADWAPPAMIDEDLRYHADGIGEIPAGSQQVYVVSSDGGTPRRLTSITSGGISGLSWGADSVTLYFSHGALAETGWDFREADIVSVTLGGEIAQVTDYPGGEYNPQVSPDGQTLAFTHGPRSELSNMDAQLMVRALSGGEPRQLLADLDRPVAGFAWDGNRDLFVQIEDAGHMVLGRTSARGGDFDRLTDAIGGTTTGRPYTSGSFSASDNGRWAATLASPYKLADVGVGTRRGVRGEITALSADTLGRRELAQIERFTWESSADGLEIEGWIAYPPGFDPDGSYPMILEIHGGPHTAYGPQFSAEVQLMASAGYVVFYTNPRGSTSYGMEFANLIDDDYPGQDVDDLLSGIDALVARGFIDEDRLFVTGGSGGGVLTAELIGNDERFAAAAVGKPVINWTSFFLHADLAPIMNYWFERPVWEDPQEYWRRSPLADVANVTTPTLVFVGSEDRRTPVSESEQYFQALQLLGVESRFVRIQGAPHGIASASPVRLLQKVGHILAWFEEHDPGAEAEE